MSEKPVAEVAENGVGMGLRRRVLRMGGVGVCAVILPCLLLAPPAASGELPPNRWVAMNEPPMGVQLLGWDEIRYAPELEGVLFYGAYRSFTSENQNAIWLYRFRENRWRLLHINLFVNRDELASDGGQARFRKTERGKFELTK